MEATIAKHHHNRGSYNKPAGTLVWPEAYGGMDARGKRAVSLIAIALTVVAAASLAYLRPSLTSKTTTAPPSLPGSGSASFRIVIG